MSRNEITRPGAFTRAVTPSDTLNLADGITRGFNLGVGGNVKVTFADGSTDTLVGLVAGVPQPYQVLRIWATGTTAASISAIY